VTDNPEYLCIFEVERDAVEGREVAIVFDESASRNRVDGPPIPPMTTNRLLERYDTSDTL
jgi:hypothetical protein